MEYNTLGVMLRTLRCRLFGTADVGRWCDAEAFDSSWHARTRLIAEFVPAGMRVIEFGAGQRKLESQLNPSCSYIPSDLVARGPNTLVLDLNARPLPDLGPLKLDVAVFAGVLEYVSEPVSLVAWLSRQVDLCIASYECARTRPRTLGRLKETFRRTGAGWVNSFTEADFVALFQAQGFSLTDKRNWCADEGHSHIFVFRRSGAPPTRP